MKQLTLMVAPPGAGKSTYARNLNLTYVNQDLHGKEGHKKLFLEAIAREENIVVDRLNFSKEQRNRYLERAKEAGYKTKIVVLHESFETCMTRCLERKNHETIKTKRDASQALHFFFKKYERVEDNEADEVVRIWPEGEKQVAIYSDIDGTIANCEHRRHFVNPDIKPEGFRKNWSAFFAAMPNDTINFPVYDVLNQYVKTTPIVFCSGRPDNYRKETTEWLEKFNLPTQYLFMRNRSDGRPDNVVKEILYEFEIKTQFNILFALDDRDQVVKMLRKQGVTVFQVAEGDF